MLSLAQGVQTGVSLYSGGGAADNQLKSQVRCAYAQSAYTAATFGDPASLDPTKDQNIIAGGAPIFTAAQMQSDSDIQKTASVMKLVCNGYAAAGTITLGGFDYHDSTRATGETRNFKAGQMIGAVLEYAQRVGTPLMVYVFSDGSLSSSSMVDTSAAGRDKLAWQGDNQTVSSTFFLVYSPKGRPSPVSGAASQQIGWYTPAGAVDTTSSPAANSVTQIPEVMLLNYMALIGQAGQFSSVFKMQGLGSATAQAGSDRVRLYHLVNREELAPRQLLFKFLCRAKPTLRHILSRRRFRHDSACHLLVFHGDGCPLLTGGKRHAVR